MAERFDDAQIAAFYTASLIGLRALDARERVPRRFGPDADARWKNFRGHLGTAARLDILVRDGAVTWRAAFSPAQVFRLPGLAADEPFGPDWSGLEDHQAERFWAGVAEGGHLGDCARALGIEADAVSMPDITPSTRLVIAGGAAILAVGTVFAERPDLSWSDQVLVVADGHAERHLAGLVAPLVGAGGPTHFAASDEDTAEALKAARFLGAASVVESPDASSGERDFARRVALGG